MDSVCNFLLMLVCICTMISYFPQIWKLIRTKKSEDISASSWVLYSVSSLSYFIYTLIQQDLMLIASGGLEFILNFTVLILTLFYRPRVKA